MAITTLDGAIAGMQPPKEYVKLVSPTLVVGRYDSPFYRAGMPGAAVAPTPGIAGAALTTYAGQIPFTNPVAGNSYLARLQLMASQPGVFLLCDRLWHNSGISVTTTGNQTINSAAWPARDLNGSTNGVGVYIGLEVSTATGAGASVVTIVYTNDAGAGTKTGTCNPAYAASSAIGAFYTFLLAAGDTGVRSIQTYASTVSMTSGTIHLVAYRVLARLEVPAGYVGNAVDALTGGFTRLYDNTVPFILFLPSATTAANYQGQMIVTQG